jgi:hypothetical protein
MSRIRGTHWFQVGRLYARTNVLGRSLSFERDECTIVVLLPDEAGSFPLWRDADDVALLGSGGSRPDGSDPFQAVGVLQVSVEEELPISASDFRSQRRDAAVEALSEFHKKAENIAQLAARDFVDWVRRDTGLTTLGLSGAIPSQPHQAVFHDLDLNERLPMGFVTAVATLVPVEMTLSQELMTRAEERLANGETPSLAVSLLGDARSLQLGNARLDLARGVLAAAMACEVQIKTTLTELCDPESRALLEIVLEKPREVTLQAASLLDLAAKAVVGRSLKDENRALYRRVIRLFEIRNAIAHRGAVPEEAEARDAIATAGEAMDWLRSLGSQANSHEDVGRLPAWVRRLLDRKRRRRAHEDASRGSRRRTIPG